jgi:hypothetical protein
MKRCTPVAVFRCFGLKVLIAGRYPDASLN